MNGILVVRFVNGPSLGNSFFRYHMRVKRNKSGEILDRRIAFWNHEDGMSRVGAKRKARWEGRR